MRWLMVLGAVLVALNGCARYTWQKDGATTADFNVDKYRCSQEATRSTYTSNPSYSLSTGQYAGQSTKSGSSVDRGMYNLCMEAAGWSLVRR